MLQIKNIFDTNEKKASLSINGIFWIQVSQERVSIASNYIDKEIHATIAFNKSSADINLHLTRNINTIEGKPKIELIRLSKKDFEQLIEPLAFTYISSIIEYFDIHVIDYKKGYFLPHNEQASEQDAEMFAEEFKDDLQIKRRSRVKINTNVVEKFKDVSQNDTFKQRYLSRLKEFCPNCDKCGTLHLEGESFFLLKINNLWYKIKNDLDPLTILKKFMDEMSINYLIDYIKNSSDIIKTLNNYKEAKSFNKPLLIWWCSPTNSLKSSIISPQYDYNYLKSTLSIPIAKIKNTEISNNLT